MPKVEMLIQICINGRPVWRKAKDVRPELSMQLEDQDYDRVLAAAIAELTTNVKTARAKLKEKVGAK